MSFAVVVFDKESSDMVKKASMYPMQYLDLDDDIVYT